MKIVLWLALVLTGNVLMSLNYKRSVVVDSNIGSDTIGKGVRVIRLSSPFTVNAAVQSAVAVKGVAGFSKKGFPIEVYYFPGTGNKKAMVIGGVHGSELSAIEVAHQLVGQLTTDSTNDYSVIVIPCLFPDNAKQAIADPGIIGSVLNVGRYSQQQAADPNRQMPSLGTAFDNDHPFDHAGRMIEPENQLLLKLIREFRPERIVNLHAIRVTGLAGIYADPRTTSDGKALEYASDSSLAIDMAMLIEKNGGHTPGNQLDKKPTSLYYCDPPVAQPGKYQPRNLLGSKLPGNRGYGVSLGSWASTAIEDDKYKMDKRPAIRLITMEFPGYKRPVDYSDAASRENCRKEVVLYAMAIREIFLEATRTPVP